MAVATPDPYPATLSVESPDKIANWRPLVQWLLAIPHFVVLYVLGIVASVLGFVAWLAVLITGKLPSGIAEFLALYLRYGNRVTAYAGYLRPEYPPFSFETGSGDAGDYAGVRTDLNPALADRNRLTTFFRFFLVIPHAVALFFVGIAAGVAWLVAFFAVLFTGRWPEGLHRFVIGYMRWSLRVNAYYYLLTDEYPPFTLD